MARLTYKDVVERENIAKRMIRDGCKPTIINKYPPAWSVPSEDGKRNHIVTQFDGKYNCTCEDYRYHGGVLHCKHINVVKFTIGDIHAKNVDIQDEEQDSSMFGVSTDGGNIIISITIPKSAIRSIIQK